jgi:hypothetical protein
VAAVFACVRCGVGCPVLIKWRPTNELNKACVEKKEKKGRAVMAGGMAIFARLQRAAELLRRAG